MSRGRRPPRREPPGRRVRQVRHQDLKSGGGQVVGDAGNTPALACPPISCGRLGVAHEADGAEEILRLAAVQKRANLIQGVKSFDV